MTKRKHAVPPPAKESVNDSRKLIPAEAALSFLKDTKGTLFWSIGDLSSGLKVGRGEAEQIIALLHAQGYVQAREKDWITTPAGESVSGATPPRFTRESVERALVALKERIKQNNEDPEAKFKIPAAVAFGDFLLSDRARVQAADVGIKLIRRDASLHEPRSATDAQEERDFLRGLRGKTQMLHLRPFAKWMSLRSHQNLL